jgi:hypothetical protein
LVLDIQDLDAVQKNTGLVLPQAGKYIVDFKCLKSYKKQLEWEYRFSYQGATYMELYNRMYPEAPVVGFIFDVILRHVTLSKEPRYAKTGKLSQGSSFMAFFQQEDPDAVLAVDQLVQIGKANYDNNIANPSACFGQYGPCFWLTSGKCNRR